MIKSIRNLIICNISIILLCSCTNDFSKSTIESLDVDIGNITEEQEISSSIQNGNEIIQSLQKYYSDNGVYPSELDELVPNYLSSLPLTLAKNEFGYFNGDVFGDESIIFFNLCFEVLKSQNKKCCYSQPIDDSAIVFGWECGQSTIPE